VPEGFSAGSLDFASSPIAFLIYGCMNYLKYIGAGILTIIAVGLLVWNRK
jgi:PTS system galactitol-specific IIC component